MDKTPRILIISTQKKKEHEVGLYNYLVSSGFNVNIVKVDNLVIKVGRDNAVLHRMQDIKNKYDIIIPFIDKKYDSFYKILLRIFEEENVDTYIKSKYLDYAHDSNLLIPEIDKHNISALKTYISLSGTPIMNLIENIEFPILIKVAGNGKNIFVRSKESLSSILDTIGTIHKYIIIKDIFPNMMYEEYLYIDESVFGLQKKGEEYFPVKEDHKIKDIASKLRSITESKIILFSVYRDENGKAYFDDLLIPYNLDKFVDHYGNAISLSISKSLIKERGISTYIKWLSNNMKLYYLWRKK